MTIRPLDDVLTVQFTSCDRPGLNLFNNFIIGFYSILVWKLQKNSFVFFFKIMFHFQIAPALMVIPEFFPENIGDTVRFFG